MLSSIWDQVINMGSIPIEPDEMDNPNPPTPGERQSDGSDCVSKAHLFRKAEKANKVGMICIFVVSGLFNVCFWGIAINEYVRPAEQYITETDADACIHSKCAYSSHEN